MTVDDTKARERILAVALDKFRQFGTRRVTMDEIATALRMSKKTLYRHFSGKRDLVRQLAISTLGVRIEALRDCLVRAQSAEDAFTSSFAALQRLPESASPVFMADVRADYPEVWDEIDATRSEVLRLYAEWVAHGARAGVIREGIVPEVVAGIMKVVLQHYMIPETFRDSDLTPREAIATWNILLVSGLFTDPPEDFEAMVKDFALTNA